MKLLSDSNPKIQKGQSKGYLTFIMHLAPGKLSGFNVCPGASAGCLSSCLNTAGRGRFEQIQHARIRKTKWFFEDRDSFMNQLVKDIAEGIRKADRNGMIPVFRLNGTSDIRWENIPVPRLPFGGAKNIFEMFPNVQFYDYTKLSNRRNIPANYHLTFSRSESNDDKIPEAIESGMNIAVVFSTKKNEDLPSEYVHPFPNYGRILPVVDGDDTDLRFLDPDGCIVGLRSKGRAKKDMSGFVVHCN